MREVFILIAHLLVTLVRLARPRGLGAVAAESLAVKHQLLIMQRAQRRAPKLTPWDRLVLGVCAFFVSPKRIRNGCDTETLYASLLSPRSREAQVSPALRPEQAPALWTKRSVKRTDRRGHPDEAAKPPLRLPENCRANLQRIRYRNQ
jgi:hypothetical protein